MGPASSVWYQRVSRPITLRTCYSSTFSFKTRPTDRLYMLRAKVLTILPEGLSKHRRRVRRAARKQPQAPGL